MQLISSEASALTRNMKLCRLVDLRYDAPAYDETIRQVADAYSNKDPKALKLSVFNNFINYYDNFINYYGKRIFKLNPISCDH